MLLVILNIINIALVISIIVEAIEYYKKNKRK